jgi:uncharacterized membrane protein HdeD (DUF308 family)
MPPRRERKPSTAGRFVAGVAGVALLITGAIGVVNALRDKTGQGNPIMALAVLLPAVILLRYAFTGVIKGN